MHQYAEQSDEVSGRGRQASARRWLAAATAALLFASLLGLATAPAQSAESGDTPKIVGSFPKYGKDIAARVGVPDLKAASNETTDGGIALVYPKLDRLYQIYNLVGDKDGTLVFAERDLGTFELLRVVTIEDHVAELANGANGAEWVATFDNAHDRLYIAYEPTNTVAGIGVDEQQLPGLLGIDLHTLAYTDSKFPNFVAATGGQLLHLVGLEFDESTDTLLILQAAIHNANAANTLVLAGWKGEELLKGGQLSQVAPRPIRACRRDPLNDGTSQYLTPILVAEGPDLDGDGSMKSWLMVPCFSTTYSSSVVIARIERSAALDPRQTTEKAIVAPAGVNNWAVDQKHGRLFLVNNSGETDAWVYEAKSNAFVGIIAMSEKGSLESGSLSLGVDEGSGRLYGRAFTYGLMIVAAAQDPVPQADAYPSLGAPGSYRLLIDPKRNRVLSLPGDSIGAGGGNDAYQVISVPAPLPAPKRENPDSRTTQTDEAPGKTVAQYGGNASAYGLRALFARGVSGAVPSNGVDSVGKAYKDTNSYCGFTDREVAFARITKTEFSDNSRFARAAAVDVDNATVVDLGDPSRCDLYNAATVQAGAASDFAKLLHTTGLIAEADRRTATANDPAPVSGAIAKEGGSRTAWDYEAADCSTEDGGDTAGPNSNRLAGPTSVKCTEKDGIEATAEARLKAGDSLPVSIARTITSTKVTRDAKLGLVSTATARLEGVRIGEISIGFIENTAKSFAKGRKGGAGTVFEAPKIGFVDGVGVPSCTDRCDIEAVLKALNNALAGKAEFRRITPEPRLAAGSPGGYEAGILKSEKQVASDNSLSGDRSVEIPALEMVVYNDNASVGRARQLYQFAGVRVDSHYGIQLVGTGSGGADFGAVNDGVDVDSGAITPGLVPLPDAPLAANLPGAGENILKRFVRQSAAGANYSLRLIFANPREAMLMATVWALIWGPFVAARRRRALKAVATADPEGPFFS